MQMKKDTGLLDAVPGPFPPNIPNPVGSQQSLDEAKDAIRESIVLLKNSGVLPIPLTEDARKSRGSTPWSAAVKRIAVVGPSANSLAFQTGGWTIHWQGALNDKEFTLPGQMTLLEGIISLSRQQGIQVNYQSGCNIDGSYSQDQIDAAVQSAKQSDIVIVAIGEKNYAEAPGNIDDLNLPWGQQHLVDVLSATGVPVVTVLFEGRPRILHNIPDQSKAVIHAMLPGPLAGVPIAEILFGLPYPFACLPSRACLCSFEICVVCALSRCNKSIR
jgi:beta-glucosidase